MNMLILKTEHNLSHMFLVESTFYMPEKVHQHSVHVWWIGNECVFKKHAWWNFVG